MTEQTEPVKKTVRNQLGPGPGRPKGVPNKNTRMLKEALLQAAEEAGGAEGLVGYLRTQATANPGPFMSLLGKVLPMQVTGEDGGPVQITRIELVPLTAGDDSSAD